MSLVIDIAAQFTGKTAFDKAQNSTEKLQKSVKNLGRTLGVALGTAAIVNYGKQSVKAFAADDNAARSLGKTLENLGLNTRYAGSELNGYISRLEQQTGVLDDELRPAMDRLLRATGSVTKSQELLGLALDISAGTGKDLTSVSQGLQKAYLGNNASLGRLGVGLTKAELKSSSFLDIQTKLTTLFAGQAKDAADSFQGSLNKLTIASNNAKEAIGKGLVDALSILTGGNGSVNGAVGTIDKMSTGIADGAKNIAYMIKQFESLKPIILTIGALLLVAFAPITAAVLALGFVLAKGGQNLKKAAYARGEYAGGTIKQGMSISGQTENALGKKQRMAKEKENKILATGNTLKAIDNANTKEKLALTAGEKALAALKRMFDLDGIQLQAALNSSITKEDEARVNALIALKNSDGALALQALAALNAAKATDILADKFKNFMPQGPSSTFYTPQALATAQQNQAYMAEQLAPYYGNQPSPSSSFYTPKALELQNQFSASSNGMYQTTSYTINAQGIGDQQIAAVVQNAIQDLNRYGNSTTYAGAI